jgi:hypothetical protein
MIPILQFDPSSLSIWYDTHVINRMRGNLEVGAALDFALRSRYSLLMSHIEDIDDSWIKTRCATVATAVWHEKRHFLDYILTNYGAFRLRQFFLIYCNIPNIMDFARKNEELLVPIQSYLDKIFCDHIGVKPPNEDIIAMAKEIRRRKEMLADDRRIIQSRFGKREMGGEALLEALAHHFEIASAHLLFGSDMIQSVRADVPDKDLLNARYQWLYEILLATDLIEVDTTGQVPIVNATGFVPICYAALACRLWKQKQEKAEGVSSYLPNYRFASLIPALKPHRKVLNSGRILDAWDVVNVTCRELFGRSCLDEMEVDLQHEESFIGVLKGRAPESLEVRAYSDFHSLRRRLFNVLKNDPAQILADVEYSLEFSSKMQPFVVVAASAGEIGNPPPDYDRLLGYADPEDSESRWWWAAIAKDWPEHDKSDVICLRDRRAWIDIISDAAPFAKLAIDGRNIRTMLGPELLSAQKRVNYHFSTNVRVDPRYAFPRNNIAPDNWYYITGRNDFRCDLTWETVRKPEGIVVDPWILRLWPSLVDHLLGSLADKNSLMRNLQRDWSPWLLSEEFRELFEEAAEDTSLLVESEWSR